MAKIKRIFILVPHTDDGESGCGGAMGFGVFPISFL